MATRTERVSIKEITPVDGEKHYTFEGESVPESLVALTWPTEEDAKIAIAALGWQTSKYSSVATLRIPLALEPHEVHVKIREAFKQLRKQGWIARMNYWCCQSCA